MGSSAKLKGARAPPNEKAPDARSDAFRGRAKQDGGILRATSEYPCAARTTTCWGSTTCVPAVFNTFQTPHRRHAAQTP